MFCREQAALLKPLEVQLANLGCTLIAIGNGTSTMALDFVEQFEIPYTVYTDPNKETYSVLGMRRGVGIGLGTLRSAFSVRSEGFKQGKIAGDVFQQGGEAFINQQGQILWVHRCINAEDHSSTQHLLETAQRLFG